MHIDLSFTHPIFLTRPFHGNLVQDVPTIAPPTLMLPSRVVARVVSHPFSLRGLPPPCASPSENAFQGVDHRTGSFIADHGSPHTFGNPFTQKGQTHLYPYLPGLFAGSCTIVDPCFFFLSFEAEETKHCFCLPHLDPFEGLYGPRPILTSEGEDGKYVVHNSSTLDLP